MKLNILLFTIVLGIIFIGFPIANEQLQQWASWADKHWASGGNISVSNKVPQFPTISNVIQTYNKGFPRYVELHGNNACLECFNVSMKTYYGGAGWSIITCDNSKKIEPLWPSGNFNCPNIGGGG